MPAGRPLKYKSVKKLKADCDKYFQDCVDNELPFTITGLALAIGTCRQTLLNYEIKPEYMDTIKEAKLKCENYAEVKLFNGQPTGPIFSLKCNYDWRDNNQSEVDGDGVIDVLKALAEQLPK